MAQSLSPTSARVFVPCSDQTARNVMTQGMVEDSISLRMCNHYLNPKSVDDFFRKIKDCPDCMASYTPEDLQSRINALNNPDLSADKPSSENAQAKQLANQILEEHRVIDKLFDSLRDDAARHSSSSQNPQL